MILRLESEIFLNNALRKTYMNGNFTLNQY